MWFYERMPRIQWTKHLCNDKVLRKIGIKMMFILKETRRKCLGCIMRIESVENMIFPRYIEGKRDRELLLNLSTISSRENDLSSRSTHISSWSCEIHCRYFYISKSGIYISLPDPEAFRKLSFDPQTFEFIINLYGDLCPIMRYNWKQGI